MTHIEARVRKWGNSVGVVIPWSEVERLGLSPGDVVDLTVETKEPLDGFGIAKGASTRIERDDIHEDLG